jgi:phage terminase small subunit
MARGRKKLAALRILEGNPSKRLMPTGIDALGEPFVPEHLTDDARGCIEIIKRSMPPNIYSALDTFLLATFGVAWAIHKRATLEMANPDFAWITTSETGMRRPSPWVAIANQQAKVMANLAARLGLDTITRESMGVAGSPQQRSEFDGLLAGQTLTYTRDDEAQ